MTTRNVTLSVSLSVDVDPRYDHVDGAGTVDMIRLAQTVYDCLTDDGLQRTDVRDNSVVPGIKVVAVSTNPQTMPKQEREWRAAVAEIPDSYYESKGQAKLAASSAYGKTPTRCIGGSLDLPTHRLNCPACSTLSTPSEAYADYVEGYPDRDPSGSDVAFSNLTRSEREETSARSHWAGDGELHPGWQADCDECKG